MEIWALRDSGNQGGVLIDESLVDESQTIRGKTVKLKGIFDSDFRNFPVATVALKKEGRVRGMEGK